MTRFCVIVGIVRRQEGADVCFISVYSGTEILFPPSQALFSSVVSLIRSLLNIKTALHRTGVI